MAVFIFSTVWAYYKIEKQPFFQFEETNYQSR